MFGEGGYHSKLRNISLLIVDHDFQLSPIVRSVLLSLGFSDVTLARNGKDAKHLLTYHNVDLVFTEWNLEHMSGPDLVRYVRSDKSFRNPLLPMIMLTGRGSAIDVQTARDCGVNEYLLKPLNAKTIVHRISEIVERPRPFVLSQGFTGPDRRRKGTAGIAPEKDRRDTSNQPALISKDQAGAVNKIVRPRMVPPDFSLRKKLGINTPLSEIITDSMIAQAQDVFNDAQDASLEWIREDIAAVEQAIGRIAAGDKAGGTNALNNAALSIKSRAGTFGYACVSDIAWQLYCYCRAGSERGQTLRSEVLLKHAQSIKALIAHKITGDAGETGRELLKELRELTKKYSR